jgi:N-acetyl-gamma-glutamyl-phosphate reductase
LANLEALQTSIESAGITTAARPPRIAVAGVSGYAGGELARLLLHHPALNGTKPTFLGRADEAEVGPSTSLEALHPYLMAPATTESTPVFSFS